MSGSVCQHLLRQPLGGLGSIIAKQLYDEGVNLALLYAPFESSKVQDVLEAIFGSLPLGRVSTIECDITSQMSVNDAFQRVSELDGIPSILVNAAVYVSVQPLEDTTEAETLQTLHTNLIGPINTSIAFFHLYQSMVAKQKNYTIPGRIVSISSQAAHVALDGHAAYCASKAGLIGYTRCMASEWGSKGMTANTVSPTVTWTPLPTKAWADAAKREKHLSQIPTGRFSVPSEIAHAVVFLCSDNSGMINGADLRVDGGFTICRT